MRVLDLRCNQCAAQLDVPKKVRFLTCTFCGAQLKVENRGGAAYTEALEEIAQGIKDIKRQNELERLDREWLAEREVLGVRSDSEGASIPSIIGGVLAAGVFCAGGALFCGLSIKVLAPGSKLFAAPFFFMGATVFVAGLRLAYSAFTGPNSYRRARESYQRRRRSLLNLDDSQSSSSPASHEQAPTAR